MIRPLDTIGGYMRKQAVLAIAAALVVGAGCAALGRQTYLEPDVTLKDVRIRGLGVTGGSMDVMLNVYNPNGFRLDATQLTYRVFVDTVHFADGVLDSRFTVQANDSTAVTIPVNFTYAGIGQAGRQLLNTGVLDYRVAGEVRVGTPIGSFSVPYDRTGRFSTFGNGRD